MPVSSTTVQEEHKREQTISFHWDVGISLENDTEFNIRAVKDAVKIKVDTKFGGGTTTEIGTETIPIPIPKTTVAPQPKTLFVTLNTEVYSQPFELKIQRTVKQEDAPESDTYDMTVLGEVLYPNVTTVTTVLWGPDEPYSG